MEEEARSSHFLLWTLFLIAIAFLIVFAMPGPDDPGYQHAVERHGSDATTVIQCYDRNGAIISVYNPNDGRCAHFVETGRQYGVVITAQDKIVTAFKTGKDIAGTIGRFVGKGYTFFFK